MNFNKFKFKKYYPFVVIFITLLGLIAFLDMGLAAGFILLGFLFGITFLILLRIGIKSKTIYLLLLIALAIHLSATLFIHYADFQPFSGGIGDYRSYHQSAVELSERFRQGIFSLEGFSSYYPKIYIPHYYPVLIAVIYSITVPEMIVGQLFGVWLAVISVLLTYLIVLEIGGSKKWAFLMGFIVSIYPSYLFYGSLLLKDNLVVPLTLFALLFCLKLIKKFLWRDFLIFYLILIALFHFRFYIGYAVIFTFIFSWFLLTNLIFKKRLVFIIVIIILLGFIPEISANQGFYGIKIFKGFLNPKTIILYQEVYYRPSVIQTQSQIQPQAQSLSVGFDSTFIIKTYLPKPLSYLEKFSKSFIYVLLGPLPWQMKYSKHFLALFETIPWYFLIFLIGRGIVMSIKQRYKIVLPLVLFSLIVLAIMTVYFSNFGVITRIRIPAFISLLCLIPFGLSGWDKKAFNFLSARFQTINLFYKKS